MAFSTFISKIVPAAEAQRVALDLRCGPEGHN
jgi:hypothetical protein